MQDKKNKYELKYVDGKVELDERLLIMSLLDDLLREGLINVATYKKVVVYVKKNIM